MAILHSISVFVNKTAMHNLATESLTHWSLFLEKKFTEKKFMRQERDIFIWNMNILVENRKTCGFFMLPWGTPWLLLFWDAVYYFVLKWNTYLPFLLVFSFKNILREGTVGKFLSMHLKLRAAMCTYSPSTRTC